MSNVILSVAELEKIIRDLKLEIQALRAQLAANNIKPDLKAYMGQT